MQYTIRDAQITFNVFIFKSQFAYYLGSRTCPSDGSCTSISEKQLFASLSACDSTGCIQGFRHSCHIRSSSHRNRHYFRFIESMDLWMCIHTPCYICTYVHIVPLVYISIDKLFHTHCDCGKIPRELLCCLDML